MPTKQRDTIVSALRDGAVVDSLWVRTESCEGGTNLAYPGTTAGLETEWCVTAYVVADDGTDEGDVWWESAPLWGPARDLDMMRHHLRGAAANHGADILADPLAYLAARAGR